MKVALSRSRWRRERISVLLTIIATSLWSHSILYARFEIGHFGLIHGLPVTFFVALAFLAVASAILWLSPEKHGKLLCLQTLLFISALWLIPLIAGGSPPLTDHAYRNLGITDHIVEQGHLDPTVFWYQSWPGAFIVGAMAVKIGSINLEPLLGVFPFLMQLLYLVPLYLFLRNTLGEARSNYCWAGAWLFYLANWGGQGYFSPQAVALFLLLTLLALVTSASIWRKDSKSFAFLGMVVLVFAALAVNHLLTSLAALSILGAIYLVKRSKSMAVVVGLCLLLVVSWDLTGAEGYVVNYVLPSPATQAPGEATQAPGEATQAPGEATQAPGEAVELVHPSFTLDPGAVAEREVLGYSTGSESHVAVAITRLSFSAMFALIGLAGAILACLVKRKFSTAIPVLVIVLAPLVLLPLAGELTQRLYLFALAPMAYFGAELLNMRKHAVTFVFCLLLVIFVPLHVIAHYGNEAMDYFSPGQVAGLHFFHNDTSEGYVTGAWPMGAMKSERYHRVGFAWDYSHLELRGDVLVVKGEFFDEDLAHYAAISQHDRAYYDFFLGTPEFIDEIELKLNTAVNYDLIYDNPDLRLYVSESIEHAAED